MIILSDSEIGKCYKFSYNVVSKTESYTRKRNKYASTEKIINDHFIGKLTELFIYHHLSNLDYQCTYPDFTINDGAKRSKYKNDNDLVIIKDGKQINLHIKTCRHDSPVRESWLIEKNTESVTNPKENDYFAFCTFFSPENIQLLRIVKASDIKWQDPRANLPSKFACYLNDLMK